MIKYYKILVYTLLLCPVCVFGQKNKISENLKKGPDGIFYKIYIDKENPKIQINDYVDISIVVKMDNDSVLYDTYKQHHSIEIIVQSPKNNGGFYTGIKLLAEGDSAIIKLSADSIYKKDPHRPVGFKGNFINYYIKVNKVIAKAKLTDQEFQDYVTEYIKAKNELHKKAEPGIIKKYIADKKYNGTQTPDSLYYIITKPGNGPKIKANDTVVVDCTIKFLDGEILSSSIKDVDEKAHPKIDPYHKYEPYHVVVGQNRIIKGWDEGLLLLNKGAKAILIIPSKLAYEDKTLGTVVPYTPLEYTIEVINVIHPAEKQ
jgi:FKBP-type peptidyl-prolyl cis-trans isomerase FkpA